MSWFRQVKLLYMATLNIMYFLLGNLISNILIDKNLSYYLILFTIATTVCALICIDRNYNKKLAIFIPFLVTLLILRFLINDSSYIIVAIYFIVIYLFNLEKIDEPITYIDTRKTFIYIMLLSLLILWLANIFLWKNIVAYSFRAYIFYLALMIITFRELLRYENNIFNEKAKYFNLSIVAVIIIMSLDPVMKFINITFSKLLNIIWSLVIGIIGFISKVVGVLVEFVVRNLRNIILKNDGSIEDLNLFQNQKVSNEIKNIFDNNIPVNSGLDIVVKFLFAILTIVIVYKMFSKIHILKKKVDKNYIEYVENIKKENRNKKNKLKKIKEILKIRKSVKEEIFYTYKKFERIANKVGVFKNYMTATQLKNVVNLKFDNMEGLEDMTNIYNEAKFSNHHIPDEELKKIKEDYENVKKQLEK
ncbi:hypothetical protein [Clostridium sp. ATCC 25772]|uniref:hypothetical protein n=1 Tax=Clostridium sp. ATCC 25772 TaxID=1676991 RepID=UPI000780D6D5|nr:hypothetical protein [Clostridium sp. ATCC 25772]